jgi:chemotaxis protein CheD
MSGSSSLTEVLLQQGGYFVGDSRYRVRTMLGSCVAITLWDPCRRIGAMSHFLLPHRRGRTHGDLRLDARYGDEALEMMLQGLSAAGAEPSTCEAKVFGGGNMFPRAHNPSPFTVGIRNGEAACRLLMAHGIALRAEDLYGNGHRQVVFDIDSGAVWARQIAPGHNGAPVGCDHPLILDMMEGLPRA